MGKPLTQQRRGKGSLRFRSPSHRFPGQISYGVNHGEKIEGEVIDIVNAPGRVAPIAKVRIKNNTHLMLAPAGITTGTIVSYTDDETKTQTGNILPLNKIPEGAIIFNIEKYPGDGGKFCRTAGSSAVLLRRGESKCDVLMPSKKVKSLSAACRATIGKVAGDGIKSRPFMKAGTKHYKMASLNRYYPHVRGVAMNAVDHPFGGSNLGRHKTVKGDAPPGQKVGSIRARTTGRKKAKSEKL